MSDRPSTRHESADDARPATRHESTDDTRPATRHESADDARPLTRHEQSGPGAPLTTHEGADEPARPRSRRRLLAPPAVEEKFEYVKELSSGGAQADVVLFTDRSNGREVAIKIYRPEASKALDRDAIEPLTRADKEHVLEFELQSDEEQIWEVQEYLVGGSLEDLVVRRGRGAQPPDFVKDVLKEVGQALDHVHSLGITHRDLKPQNILIRSERPLDCVLADFGLARIGVLSNAVVSKAGTYPYTSPEGSTGHGNKANDWWGLGVIVHELLTGRHLLSAGKDGAFHSETRVLDIHRTESWDYDDVTDPRWKLLLDGLLSPQEGRWAWQDVQQWLAGKSPKIRAVWPRRVSSSAPTSKRRPKAAYHFAGADLNEPADLARAIRKNFVTARDHLAGVRARDLQVWLHDTSLGDGADDVLKAVLDGHTSPGRAAVELQLLIEPDKEAWFRDKPLSTAGLEGVIKAAKSGDAAAIDWVQELRNSSVLSVVGRHTGTRELSRADDLLASWWRRIGDGLLSTGFWAQPVFREYVANATPALEGILLEAALSDDARRRIWDRARQLSRKIPRGAQPLTQQTTQLAAAINLDAVPEAALISLVYPAWFDRLSEDAQAQSRQAAAAKDAERRAAREQNNRQAAFRGTQRRRADVRAIWYGVIACVTVLLPWLLGRYVLRGQWPRLESSGVFDGDARGSGDYFMTDWGTGCLAIAVLVAGFIFFRPWRGRVRMLVVAALGLGAAYYWGVPLDQQEWNFREAVTTVRLRSTPYPFDTKYYTCGSAMVSFDSSVVDKSKPDVVYSLHTARVKGSTSPLCNLIDFYEGWRRVKSFKLRAGQYVESSTFSSPVSVNTTVPSKTVFTLQLTNGKKLTYKLSSLRAG
ncbi:protein kinase [Kribbella sp. NBC_00482]|uniref:serine/threonine-protein kinase n=1 Tax=Kribbella sp. NBC_00482 TaxID=2975968 RepID=UPI002E182F58